MIKMLPKYYLNDYFTLVDSPLMKEKEFMKTDIREYQNKYIMEIDLPGLKKEDIIDIYTSNLKGVDIAKKYNISPNTVYDIRKKRIWNSLE